MKNNHHKRQSNLKEWHCLDAANFSLGRLATQASILLRGKAKVCFEPHIDCGDHVVVLNARKLILSGDKMDQKQYYRHSGFPGNLKIQKVKDLHPAQVIFKAVSGMLPDNKLKKNWLKRLHIYLELNHPHQANLAGQKNSDE